MVETQSATRPGTVNTSSICKATATALSILAAAIPASQSKELPPMNTPPSPERLTLAGARLDQVNHEYAVINGDARITKLDQPNLSIFRTEFSPARGTFLLFPGGGYGILAVTKEGAAVAAVLNRAGFDVAMLEYSIAVPDARQQALAQALQAYRLLRSRSGELGLGAGQFGLMGFSAGGHLAARLMREAGGQESPDLAALIYPAYLADSEGLLPEVQPPKGSRTRVFALVAANDKPEWVAGTRLYARACEANGQSAELQILPDGGHGFGIESTMPETARVWIGLLEAFLASTP